jgi:glutamate racemase
VPYGDKSRAFVEQRSIAITEFLIKQGAKAIVVACNTATSAAITTLRGRFRLPVIGVEPALKPAAQKTRSGIIAVLATSGTLSGDKFTSLHERIARDVEVLTQPCAGLVELVEAGELTTTKTRALVERYVLPLLERGADTLVLGCTHYPFLASLIREVAGPDVSVIDPSPAVARELLRRLEEGRLISGQTSAGSERFWTTGSADHVAQLVVVLWGTECIVQQMTDE